MKATRFPAVFAVLIGVGMLGMWVMFFAAGDVPELSTEPIRLGFHLSAEALTASTMVAAGVGLIRGVRWARDAFLLGSGMLLYTMIVSPGYFAQQGEWAFVLMFAVFTGLALVATRAVRAG